MRGGLSAGERACNSPSPVATGEGAQDAWGLLPSQTPAISPTINHPTNLTPPFPRREGGPGGLGPLRLGDSAARSSLTPPPPPA
jgi:hypothetical protein